MGVTWTSPALPERRKDALADRALVAAIPQDGPNLHPAVHPRRDADHSDGAASALPAATARACDDLSALPHFDDPGGCAGVVREQVARHRDRVAAHREPDDRGPRRAVAGIAVPVLVPVGLARV